MNHAQDAKLYGVIGHPIGHTLSPLMHNTAFKALGIDGSMSAYDIEPGSLKEALQGFVSAGFGGLNVTIPHKEAIIPFLDDIDDEARVVGAINTVKFDGRSTTGYNTDIHGFLRTLEPFRTSIEGGRFLVLGAGGVARAVVYVLLRYFETGQLVVASRSLARASDLAENFRETSPAKLAVLTFQDPQITRVFEASNVIINATPAGMTPSISEMPLANPPFRKEHVVVDLIYRPIVTEFLRRASEARAQTVSGLEMFIHQGARSFELWTGKAMDIPLARKVLLEKLHQET